MSTDNDNPWDDDGESPRQQARRQKRAAADHSTKMAHTLIQLPEAELNKLALEEGLREVVDHARSMTSRGAMRREERRLAGVLRYVDLDDLETRMSNLQRSGQADVRLFHQAEHWRARLLEEGEPAAEAFCASCAGADRVVLDRLTAEATRAQSRGRPRGAGRSLFRWVMAALSEADRQEKAADHDH